MLGSSGHLPKNNFLKGLSLIIFLFFIVTNAVLLKVSLDSRSRGNDERKDRDDERGRGNDEVGGGMALGVFSLFFPGRHREPLMLTLNQDLPDPEINSG